MSPAPSPTAWPVWVNHRYPTAPSGIGLLNQNVFQLMGITYRREIDGLRAIAVVSVVLYHAGVGGTGFVGVDIFFVISGYLITALLVREQSTTNRIDLLAFYARRVRRIFPAAIACVLATLAIGSTLLSPADVAKLGDSASAAAVFGSNFYFQSVTGDYFDTRSEEMPLLHLWSLSAEEQFYFLWPAVLILAFRFRVRLLPMLGALALASFLLAESLIRFNPQAAFYQMPARFWELAAGGLVAVSPRTWPRWLAPFGTAVTLTACAASFGHFPGMGALPAVIGAATVLAAVHSGGTNRFLASKPMVGIGLISYSLYLWHWPLLAFYRATSIGEGQLSVRLQLCSVAVPIAMASYRYIERPFRRMLLPSGRIVAVGAAVSLTIALGAWAWAFKTSKSLELSPAQIGASAAESDLLPLTCHAWVGDAPVPKCPRPAAATIGIWGDSMAWSWTPAILAVDASAARFTRDGCGPFLGYLPENPHPGDVSCRDFTNLIPGNVRGLDTLVLVARWDSDPMRVAALRRAILAVSPSVGRVVVIGPTPRMREQVPRCILQGDAEACSISREHFEATAIPVRAGLQKAIAGIPNVRLYDPTPELCNVKRCPATKNGKALYWDTHHLTITAASHMRIQRLLVRSPPSG